MQNLIKQDFTEENFQFLADQTISKIYDIIDTEDIASEIDIDYHGDILYLESKQGIFVINKHSAAKEIWLSSPISGPYHFYYNEGRWQTKNENLLYEILTRELEINFYKYITE